MIKILVCDNRQSCPAVIQEVLRAAPDLDMIGEADCGRSAVSMATHLHPDVVLMDLAMPEVNGIDATRQITSKCRAARVLAVSMHSEPMYVWAMIDAGASGFVVKSNAREELVRAIRAVAAGGTYLSSCLGLAYLAKPHDAATLVKTGRGCLDRDRAP